MRFYFSFILSFLVVGNGYAQKDTSSYILYQNNWVVHTSVSIKDAPFTIKDNFKGVSKLKYRSNLNITQGIGVAYKWFAINLSYKIPGYLKDREKYGKTKYYNLDLQFNLKHWYFSLDGNLYRGYGIMGAQNFLDSVSLTSAGYYLNEDLVSLAIDLNAYYFFSRNMNMKLSTGIRGRYKRSVKGVYIRMTGGFQSLSNAGTIVPSELVPSNKSLYRSNVINSFEVGAIPGYAYINNIHGWQFGAFLGIGAAIQLKSYFYNGNHRSYLGLTPRYNLRLLGGYNVDKWFLMASSVLDHKHIRFDSFRYNQLYYFVKLTYGYRFG